jgi:lysozyme family protein
MDFDEIYSQRFNDIILWVLDKEGSFSNHPKDKGGATKFGITSAVLSHARGTATTLKDVEELRRDEAISIYHAYYWRPIYGDDLPKGLDHVLFDMAVHSGVYRSIVFLQKALKIDQDGIIGKKTLSAIREHSDVAFLIKELCAHRRRFLRQLPAFVTFGFGWENRLVSLEKEALDSFKASVESSRNLDFKEMITPAASRTLIVNGVGLFSLIASFLGYTINPELITAAFNEVAQLLACGTLILSSVLQMRLRKHTRFLTKE